MKRERQDKHSYLGGDVVDSSTTGGERKALTKAERNNLRKAANKTWKFQDRKLGSGIDPNPRHTLYYKQQLPELSIEENWASFQESLCTPLPVTFRFGCACPTIIKNVLTRRLLSDEFRTMRGRFVEVYGKAVKDNIVKPISWCNAWQVIADSGTLARNEGLKSLSDMLAREVGLGHIVRQELASMIPVILLGVHHTHIVLDVCAAPGSKTEQLLAVMQRSKDLEDGGVGGLYTGMVVANDADPKRIQTLRRRYARCGRPNLLIHCSRAEDLCRLIHRRGAPIFDSIICDVPCSGDGTLRKFPHLWRLFRPRVSLELHSLQLQIAKASALMLKEGGRMVYSTCSINPLEDEAVVSALLLSFNGRLRLVDAVAEGLVPTGLMVRPGVSFWLCDENIFTVGEPDEVATKASKARLPELTTSMYPPSPEVASSLHLERCMRILPQDQDTGGFFVAVLEKVKATKTGAKSSSKATNNTKNNSNSAIVKFVSEEKSLKTLRGLGFNPKTLSSVKKQTTTELANKNAPAMDDIHEMMYDELGPSARPSVFNDVVTALQLDTGFVVGEDSLFALALAKTATVPGPVHNHRNDPDNTTEGRQNKLRRVENAANPHSRGQRHEHGGGSDEDDDDDIDSEEEEDRLPEKTVQLVSRSVHHALQSWATASNTVQAGVTICRFQFQDDGAARLLLDYDGARSVLPLVNDARVITLTAADMLALSRIGTTRSVSTLLGRISSTSSSSSSREDVVEVEVDDGADADADGVGLSAQGRRDLMTEASLRFRHKQGEMGDHVTIFAKMGYPANASVGPVRDVDKSNVSKRRMSKAERKKLQKLPATAATTATTATTHQQSNLEQAEMKLDKHCVEKEDDSLSPDGLVIVLTISRQRLHNSASMLVSACIDTPVDMCVSYVTALKKLTS